MARIHRKYWNQDYQVGHRIEMKGMMTETRNEIEWIEGIPIHSIT